MLLGCKRPPIGGRCPGENLGRRAGRPVCFDPAWKSVGVVPIRSIVPRARAGRLGAAVWRTLMLALLLSAGAPGGAGARPAPPLHGDAAFTTPLSLVCSAGVSGPIFTGNAADSSPALMLPPPAMGAAAPLPQPAGPPLPVLSANAENGPVLVRVSPMFGRPGDIITLEGRRFGSSPNVLFQEVPARILRSSDSSITAEVPVSNTYPLVVKTEHGFADTAEPFIYVLKVENGVLHPIPLGDGRWFPHRPLWNDKPVDPIARFLEHHWEQPLAPQGEPPASFGPLEADLRPESCASCHQPQYQDWKGALHSTASSRLLRWTLRGKNAVEADACRRCHDPAAESGAWTARELFPTPEDPQHVLPRRDGVQCSVCHVRQHVRYGPPARPGAGASAGAVLPHGGFRPEKAFEDSRFCSGCHTFSPRIPPGGLVGDPFEEWRTSRFAEEGVSCQNCHMPDRRHLFRGIHDREMTLGGLTIGLEVSRDGQGQVAATATITSTNVGHMFPTYPIPRVHVRLLRDREQLGETHVIGREIDLPKRIEHWDHRLAPGESYVMRRHFQSGGEVTLQIDVVPRDRYERDLAIQFAYAESIPNHVFLDTVRQFVAHEKSMRYQLVDISVAVPPGPGVVRRVIREGREVTAPGIP